MAPGRGTDHLSQISTLWTDLLRAHAGDNDGDRARLAGLLERYQSAAFRYLTAAVGDPDLGVELFQEFALRFLRGDFRRVDPARGRFRDYVRTSLINLVRRHRAAAGRPAPAGSPVLEQVAAEEVETDPAEDQAFLAEWRKALLDRAWRRLEEIERGGGPPYFTALRARADRPDAPSGELAAYLTERLGRAEPFTDAGVRKLLQRGREELTDSMVAEVAASVPTRDRDRLASELIDLGFFGYCRAALDRWGS
jgi:DNA-directed RNA polymerase specialized sigma24 family protein